MTGREVRREGDTVTTDDGDGVTRVAVPVFTARDEERIRELVRDELNEVARTADLYLRRLVIGDDAEPLLDHGEPLVDLENGNHGDADECSKLERRRQVVEQAVSQFHSFCQGRESVAQPAASDGAGRQVIAPDRSEIWIRNFVGHLSLLTLHGRAARYVAGVLLTARRWLQCKGWFRRPPLTPCARPSDTTGGGVS